MKKSFSFSWGAVAVLGALALSCCVVVCAPYLLKYNSSAVQDTENPASLTDSVSEITTAEETTDMSIYLFHDGYEIIGGDLYCNHMWQEWILTRPASLITTGAELRYCYMCFAHQSREFGFEHGTGDRSLIDMECILQMPSYPNGCEVVCLTMVLKYLGYDVTTDELIDEHLPRGYFSTYGDDPFYFYLGNPRDLGVGCYAPCIVNTAESYFNSINEFRAVSDVSGRTFIKYREYIDGGTPVIFWGTTYMDADPEIFGTVYLEDDSEVIWRNHSHCFVMIGYTDTTYIFCDPIRGVIEYPIEDVENSHSLVYEQACIIQ